MQPYSHSPAPKGPLLTGSGYGGLIVIAVLFLILIPAALVHRPAEAGRFRYNSAYGPIHQTQVASTHTGISRYSVAIRLGKNVPMRVPLNTSTSYLVRSSSSSSLIKTARWHTKPLDSPSIVGVR